MMVYSFELQCADNYSKTVAQWLSSVPPTPSPPELMSLQLVQRRQANRCSCWIAASRIDGFRSTIAVGDGRQKRIRFPSSTVIAFRLQRGDGLSIEHLVRRD